MKESEAAETLEIRKHLRRTWGPFFSRFGRLHPIQLGAIPLVLQGRNVVVASPTASGKTEAVLAPVLERLLVNPGSHLQVLYISPTRALVNDLEVRLKDPMTTLDVTLAVKTGERPQFNAHSPQQVLLTTPESFDSLMARHPRTFRDLQWVILDELHLLDGTFRGDQLRVLLERLRLQVEEAPVQYCALSATLHTPAQIAERYFPDPETVIVPGNRGIQYSLVSLSELDGLRRSFAERKISKALFFCNSRKETEEFGRRLTDLFPRASVLVHHGSLSKREREEVERAMRQRKWAYCAATMTLELGIDIGGIDVIGLVRPPDSVSTLLQRVGRGNRHSDHTVAVALYESELEREAFVYLFEQADAGILEKGTYKPHLSVAVQQLFSFLFQCQTHGAAFTELTHLLKPICTEQGDVELIMEHLTRLRFLQSVRGKFYPAERLLNLAEIGRIHSNIEEQRSRTVIDTATGRPIGEILVLPGGETFILAGRVWQITQARGDKIYVRQTGHQAMPAVFGRRGRSLGAFFGLLPEALQQRELKVRAQ